MGKSEEVVDRPEIAVVGAGALGSFTAMALVKEGWRVLAIDFDAVEPHNTRNQLYQMGDVGLSKVEALSRYCLAPEDSEGGLLVQERRARLYDDCPDIVIFAVDSLRTRETLWMQARDQASIIFDARSGGYTLLIYAIEVNNLKARSYYEESFRAEPEAIGPCGMGVFAGLMTAGFVSAIARQYKLKKGVFPSAHYIIDMANMEVMKQKLS